MSPLALASPDSQAGRMSEFAERKQAVRRCIEIVQAMECSARDGSDASRTQDLRALRDAIERLASVGCETEARFVAEMRSRLSQTVPSDAGDDFSAQLGGAIRRLRRAPWMPEGFSTGSAGSRPSRVYFVRHAESTGNQEKRLQGSRIHGTLTPSGQLQSRHTAKFLFESFADLRAGNVLLATSPIGRAMETAQPIGECLGCSLVLEPDLAELDFGDWTGRYFADLEASEAYQKWMKDNWFGSPPAGESLFELCTRACLALSSLLSRARDTDSSLVVVTHFFPLMTIFSALLAGEPFRPDNSSVSLLEFVSGRWQPRLINHVLHLGSDQPIPVAYV